MFYVSNSFFVRAGVSAAVAGRLAQSPHRYRNRICRRRSRSVNGASETVNASEVTTCRTGLPLTRIARRCTAHDRRGQWRSGSWPPVPRQKHFRDRCATPMQRCSASRLPQWVNRVGSAAAPRFRSTPNSGHCETGRAGPFRANRGRRASPIQALMSLIGTPRRLLVCVRIIRVGEALGSTTRCRRLTLSQSTIATPNGSAVYGRDLHANGITRIVGLSLYCGGGRHHSHHEDCPDQCAHLSLHYVQPTL
jgi:hypothetical protein